ncbi:hypothetical protein LEMA_P082660.1 [Plenodomus lingam JN3]|uniref:Peptidase M14 domain-containing protein n=1 Tax=Leptosphaeria maculans (strain JN3 / isolate v23.1.3 / race Av1-4-5-6-7-8) TaxID=985895 RepID=E5A5Y2_LEPMJ|nr:hypothetical protein LEMA_P082660.1 [Plenodomus lingam JN3]CBX99027.1 hypothetical protein LEMA_P082660.1 [Plenodomus lingam JN3]
MAVYSRIEVDSAKAVMKPGGGTRCAHKTERVTPRPSCAHYGPVSSTCVIISGLSGVDMLLISLNASAGCFLVSPDATSQCIHTTTRRPHADTFTPSMSHSIIYLQGDVQPACPENAMDSLVQNWQVESTFSWYASWDGSCARLSDYLVTILRVPSRMFATHEFELACGKAEGQRINSRPCRWIHGFLNSYFRIPSIFVDIMRFVFGLAWISLAACATIRSPPATSYDGYQVHRIRTIGKLASVKRALATVAHDTWEQSAGHWDVLISRDDVAAFNALGLDSRALHVNLGESMEKEVQVKRSWKRQTNGSDDAWFDSYHPYDDHVEWWRELQASFPDNSNWTTTGTSFEGRDLFGVHLWGADGPGKPAVLYHGTVHAREWISAPTVEYITQQLIKGYQSGDNITQSFLNKYDFYIFPFVNPDGFVFTQTNDRLWRKNRQPPPANAANQTCFGRDINRNWETNWDSDPRGASPDPCSQTYRGEAPRDSPENRGLDDTVRRLRDTQGIKLYIDWHSYSQLLLFPYGDRENLYAPELGKWTRTAALVSEEIRAQSKNATTYTFGPSGATLYPTTGTSVDHIYTTGRAEFSFTIELPDYGDFGFVLPPERIRPAVEEQWVGQQVMLGLLDEEFFDGEGPAILTT